MRDVGSPSDLQKYIFFLNWTGTGDKKNNSGQKDVAGEDKLIPDKEEKELSCEPIWPEEPIEWVFIFDLNIFSHENY